MFFVVSGGGDGDELSSYNIDDYENDKNLL